MKRELAMNEEKFLVSDEDLQALDRFSKLTVAEKVRLVVYLKDHEDDIYNNTNDFGNLFWLFRRLFNRVPNA